MKRLLLVLTALALLLAGCAVHVSEPEDASTARYDPAEIHTIVLVDTTRNITVTPAADGEISLRYFETELHGYSLSQEGDTLTLVGSQKKPGAERGVSLELALPAAFDGSLEIQLDTGDVTLGATALEAVKVELVTGKISLDRCAAKHLVLHTTTGDITGTIAGAQADYSIHADTTTGSVNLQDAPGNDSGKSLTAVCVTGRVDLDFTD